LAASKKHLGTCSGSHPVFPATANKMSAHPSERNTLWSAALVLPVVPKVQHIDRVLWMQAQSAGAPQQREVVLDRDCPLIK
jgi:hypothetical protein